MTNSKSAIHADNSVTCPLNNDHDFSDLISNLLHLAHSRGFDPQQIITRATGNFLSEAGELPAITAQ